MATQSTCLLLWGLVAAFISQNMVFAVFSASSSSFQDQKNFFFPPVNPGLGSPPIDPGAGSPPIDPGVGSPPVTQTPPIVSSPPTGYYTSPPPTHGSGGSTPAPIVPSPPISYNTSPPPTHGSGGSTPTPIDPSPPISYNTSPPPSHGSGGSPPPVHHTPSHGGGHGGGHHHGGSPPANCGNPTPRTPSPRHVDPSPGHHNPSPSPSRPEYHYNPPSSGGSTPTVPSLSPPIVLPPNTPGTPLLPSPPTPTDPNSPPIGGTCDYWRNHPGMIWGLFGWWGTTIGSAFGVAALPATGSQLNLMQALSNTRTDGIGALYREGTASLLNSMVNKNFPYTTSHVKDSFVAAVGSNKAAAAQARVFKLANEGHMKLRV